MICTTYFLTFFSELIPPTGYSKNIDIVYVTVCSGVLLYKVRL